MSSQGEGSTATDAGGQPSQVRNTLHVLLRLELPLGDSLCRRQTRVSVQFLLAFCTFVCGCHLFLPLFMTIFLQLLLQFPRNFPISPDTFQIPEFVLFGDEFPRGGKSETGTLLLKCLVPKKPVL